MQLDKQGPLVSQSQGRLGSGRPSWLAGPPVCLHRLVEDYESLQIYAASMETRMSIMPLTGADGLSTCRSLAALKMIKW